MTMNKFFAYPFAVDGDRTSIPNPPQTDGSVCYDQGYTQVYSEDPTLYPTTYKNFPRRQHNQSLYDVTQAIQEQQTQSFPDYIDPTMTTDGNPYPYPILAIVRYNPGSGVQIYLNTVAGNTNNPVSGGWVQMSSLQTAVAYASVYDNNSSRTYGNATRNIVQVNTASFIKGLTFNSGSNEIVIQITGCYEITGYIVLTHTDPTSGAPASNGFALYAVINGTYSTYPIGSQFNTIRLSDASTIPFPPIINATTTLYLNAGDTVQLGLYWNDITDTVTSAFTVTAPISQLSLSYQGTS